MEREFYFCTNILHQVDKTLEQYDRERKRCRDIFVKKASDYGSSWRVLRPSSIADQMYIKAKRIRTIDEKGHGLIDDPIDAEFIGLVNYGIMALIQIFHDISDDEEMDIAEIQRLYDEQSDEVRALMVRKNTDYGEAWREMRMSSFTDLILMKLLRVREIAKNDGQTLISEGVDANYQDMVNYALFALIKIEENNRVTTN
jgi:hypothetical protein